MKKPTVNAVYDFADKIAKTMKEIGSSHVYFIFQQAFDKKGLMSWHEVMKTLDDIINLCKKKNRTNSGHHPRRHAAWPGRGG